jgi:cell division transport system ATP-binding protein
MIRVQDLTYAPQPGLAILAGVTLTIARGEWVWLRGARHAGKSVLLRIIAALLRPTQGEVWWDDVSLQRLPARALPYWRRRVGMLFAEWPLIADQPVIESVALPLIVQGTPRRRAHARVRQWFDELGLAEQAELFPHELSGSERQLACGFAPCSMRQSCCCSMNPSQERARKPRCACGASLPQRTLPAQPCWSRRGATCRFFMSNPCGG